MLRIPQRKEAVSHIRIEPDQDGRRLDNFLRARFHDIPKSRIYQMIRKGEVRVNGGRVDPAHKLQSGDRVRLPPVGRQEPGPRPSPESFRDVHTPILYEDAELLVIDKPSGIPVHGGTGRPFGIIDVLRHVHPSGGTLQLVHRLDQETSGCLLLAKTHTCLRRLHQLLRDGLVEKQYTALLKGRLGENPVDVDLPLRRGARRGGERLVETSAEGKSARTRFTIARRLSNATLAHVHIATGRTHQIRVHASQIGHPVAGDHRYGDREFNRELRPLGLRRLFLHASAIRIPRPYSRPPLVVETPLPEELRRFLDSYA